MAGKIQICNMALGRLGANLINALNEPNKEARLCNLFYDDLRDELLRDHAWGFATVRSSLARLSGIAPGPWEYQYQVPSDCLRVLFLVSSPGTKVNEFRVEGRKLYTNLDEATIVYVRRETDATRFDQHFVRALAARLAAELALPITDQKSLAEAMWALYERELARAKGSDAAENQGIEPGEDSWLAARR
ncbi:MAG: hypothetical protein AB1896_19550 [Thermodesulfobacteriota bacterium]